jgi:hypothetical protein
MTRIRAWLILLLYQSIVDALIIPGALVGVALERACRIWRRREQKWLHLRLKWRVLRARVKESET